jgi:hypothetical protein
MVNEPVRFRDVASLRVERGPLLEPQGFRPAGKFKIEHRDKTGKLIGVYDVPNGIVDVGLNSILGVYFHSDTQITTWYIALVDNAGFSAFANADTMASHAGWTESTVYSNSTRVSWGPGASASRSITNSTTADFTINGTATLKGIFITSNSTKGGTTGTLWSTAAFGSTVSVNNGDTLKITYTVSG